MHLGYSVSARLLTATTSFRANPAVIVLLCVFLTLITAHAASLGTSVDDSAKHLSI